MMNNNENAKRSMGNLTPRKEQLLEHFRRQRHPYSVKIIDGEPVVYRLEATFDVEISQSKQDFRGHPSRRLRGVIHPTCF